MCRTSLYIMILYAIFSSGIIIRALCPTIIITPVSLSTYSTITIIHSNKNIAYHLLIIRHYTISFQRYTLSLFIPISRIYSISCHYTIIFWRYILATNIFNTGISFTTRHCNYFFIIIKNQTIHNIKIHIYCILIQQTLTNLYALSWQSFKHKNIDGHIQVLLQNIHL